MEDRRRSRRLELNSELVIKGLQGDTQEAKIEVTDLSKTGVGFTSPAKLEIKGVYEANLRIWTGEVIHSFLKIVRIEVNPEDESVFNYGATFVGMAGLDANKISIYDMIHNGTQE